MPIIYKDQRVTYGDYPFSDGDRFQETAHPNCMESLKERYHWKSSEWMQLSKQLSLSLWDDYMERFCDFERFSPENRVLARRLPFYEDTVMLFFLELRKPYPLRGFHALVRPDNELLVIEGRPDAFEKAAELDPPVFDPERVSEYAYIYCRSALLGSPVGTLLEDDSPRWLRSLDPQTADVVREHAREPWFLGSSEDGHMVGATFVQKDSFPNSMLIERRFLVRPTGRLEEMDHTVVLTNIFEAW